ncbi:hypothetical protein L596_026073 [Steinernema carpocapsae]|uniref:EGF-like domain-containing protein n=2 Tax=Steinernema carpocapsae TaxID=34508 RepID=A0A4U5M094_STECR|nr:hypothetical protein L596_026073 [Steinernema carpocapsae]
MCDKGQRRKVYRPVNDFSCECSRRWAGKECTINAMIWELLKNFKSYNDDTVKMLEDILEKPELIKETVPFFLALFSQEHQANISWDHEDMFTYASFEGRELDISKDLVQWNAATLGNCFTFNHDSRSEKMTLRENGEQEGFRALVNVRQDEYLHWIDTSSLLVFVHSSKETVFGESVRFQAKPGTETSLMTSLTSFERLGGRYGKCVLDKSEVASYYYDGDYMTDGCLRSCYQDEVFKACKCMDPRYPRQEDAPVCDLSQRSCILELSRKKGDPSTWSDCKCPLPCSSTQYNVRWSQTALSTSEDDCSKYAMNNKTFGACARKKGNVLINVYLPYIIQNTFKEEPKIDFNKFIANLGGLLGVLCGISIITFIEFGFLIVRLAFA